MLWLPRLLIILVSFTVLKNVQAKINLKDLGLSKTEVALSPEQVEKQKSLETRHSMLKTHEVLGLSTLGLMTASMFTGGSALGSNTHMYLGMATGSLYLATAFYSLAAPKPADIKDRGNIVWHKRLAWIHFPAMVLAPILGYMYKKNEESGKKSSAIVKQHSTIAGVGFGAFAISAALMTIEF
jgi:cytochrome b561